MMTKSLFVSAGTKFLLGVVLLGALLFLPAGTLNWPQGWLLMGILFVPMFIAMPLVLGSGLSLLVFLAYPFIIIKRIRNEEEVLTAELPGYAEHKQQVKWRLIPFIW